MTHTTARTTVRSTAAALLSLALLGAGAGAASAKGGDPEVRTAGHCSAASVWKLKTKTDDGRLETELEVDSNRVGPDLVGRDQRQRRPGLHRQPHHHGAERLVRGRAPHRRPGGQRPDHGRGHATPAPASAASARSCSPPDHLPRSKGARRETHPDLPRGLRRRAGPGRPRAVGQRLLLPGRPRPGAGLRPSRRDAVRHPHRTPHGHAPPTAPRTAPMTGPATGRVTGDAVATTPRTTPPRAVRPPPTTRATTTGATTVAPARTAPRPTTGPTHDLGDDHGGSRTGGRQRLRQRVRRQQRRPTTVSGHGSGDGPTTAGVRVATGPTTDPPEPTQPISVLGELPAPRPAAGELAGRSPAGAVAVADRSRSRARWRSPTSPVSTRRIVAQLVAGICVILAAITIGGSLAARRLAEREAVNDAANTADVLAETLVQPALTTGSSPATPPPCATFDRPGPRPGAGRHRRPREDLEPHGVRCCTPTSPSSSAGASASTPRSGRC